MLLKYELKKLLTNRMNLMSASSSTVSDAFNMAAYAINIYKSCEFYPLQSIIEPDLSTFEVFGIRPFWDLQQNQEKHDDENWQDKMMQLEMRVAQNQTKKPTQNNSELGG